MNFFKRKRLMTVKELKEVMRKKRDTEVDDFVFDTVRFIQEEALKGAHTLSGNGFTGTISVSIGEMHGLFMGRRLADPSVAFHKVLDKLTELGYKTVYYETELKYNGDKPVTMKFVLDI